MASTGKDKVSRFPAYFSNGLVLALWVLYLLGAFIGSDNRWTDSLFRWRGIEQGDPRVSIVAIDDPSIAKIGQFPWPRSVYKRLLERLYALGVKVVGMDILFPNPSTPAEDAALVEATRQAGDRLVHAIDIDQGIKNENVFRYPFPALRKAAKKLGIVYQPFIDLDGVVRDAPLFIGTNRYDPTEWVSDPQRQASLGFTVRARFEGLSPKDYPVAKNRLTLNIRGEKGVLRQVGLDKNGKPVSILTQVYGFRRIPAWKVLENKLGEEERSALKGGIALVGSTTVGAFDHYASPFTDLSPGVEVHANLIDNLLNGRALRHCPRWLTLLIVLAMAFLGRSLMRLGPVQAAFSALGGMVAWMVLTYVTFRGFYLLDFTAPLVALAGNFVGLLVHKTLFEERQKRAVRQMFGQYVAPEVVDILVKDPGKIRLGGERRDMTVLFLDIAHFTTISEKMTPEALIQFLNFYLTGLTDVILKNKGVVDKYIGDCIMAFWNAPLDEPRHRELASLAAVECIEAVERLNREYAGPPLPEKPAVRIGLNSGEMVVGNTGSARKLAYTVLGDEVNLASRLEGANKFFGSRITASENTYEKVKDVVEARVLGQVRVLGKTIPIKVYELLGKKGELPEPWPKALRLYHRGVADFLKRDFAAAKEEFGGVLKLIPGDNPSSRYRNFCEDYVNIPPPPHWGGVFDLSAK